MPGILTPTRRTFYERTYTEVVLATDPIAYWPLGERFGSTAYDVTGNGLNGAITGATLGQPGIGDGLTSMLFDGVNDFINVYSAALNAAFNGSEGTVSIWGLCSDWANNSDSYLWNFYDDASNFYNLRKDDAPAGANDIRIFANVGGAGGGLSDGTLTGSTEFNHFVVTWSDLANELELFQNNISAGVVALPNAWTGGGLNGNRTTLGAWATTPTSPWPGRLAHCALYNRAITPAEVEHLYRSRWTR